MLSYRALLSIFTICFLQGTFAITKVSLVDHDDPNYTDKCLEVTGELCDYCCLIDFEWCSRDIYNCRPVRDRNLSAMKACFMVLGGVIFSFPLIGCFLRRCMMIRYCTSCFRTTNGMSIFECICRCSYFFCCFGRRFNQTYQKVNLGENKHR